MSDILATVRALMRDFEPPPACELHCGVAVWELLRELGSRDAGPAGIAAALGGRPLYGIPVHVDRKMRAGAWELREGGETVKSGDITPDVAGVFYVPGVGFMAFTGEAPTWT